VSDALEQMVDSLLYEGYALYPYTPQATKNATPTPFGIVYPPDYAAHLASTFDHLQMQCLLAPGEGAELSGEVRFLAPSGERHQAAPQRAALPPVALETLGGDGVDVEFRFDSEDGPPLELRLRLSANRLDDGRTLASLRVENLTDAPGDLDRAGALRHSAISTHPILRVSNGRFVSVLESGGVCESVNTWPVLASPDDDVMLGTAIVLPDHPQIAPESKGNLFDGTEIEEALLLHVQVLSDGEREAIERSDPAVKEMIDRAVSATPDDMVRLHGRVTVSEPGTGDAPLSKPAAQRDPLTLEPPTPSSDVTDPSAGQADAEVDGVVFRRGAKVVLHPSADADLHARMCDGRTATIEKIFTELDGRIHFGVTIDGDPGQELMRETNRLLFFFAGEVELAP
jgi:hypothetical protein